MAASRHSTDVHVHTQTFIISVCPANAMLSELETNTVVAGSLNFEQHSSSHTSLFVKAKRLRGGFLYVCWSQREMEADFKRRSQAQGVFLCSGR